jgi:D-inositol-3-phosphate glycosyltransferase
MNVYVRELATALARSGARCEVFTRLDDPSLPPSREVEPGFRLHFVEAGPPAPLPKEELPGVVAEWAKGVEDRLFSLRPAVSGDDGARLAQSSKPVDLVHANYWMSAVAGHSLKHSLELPLVTTFHTLERVKAEAGQAEPSLAERRAAAEAAAIGCSDAVLVSSPVEAEDLVRLYSADPARIEVILPGVDRAFFSPGDQGQARRATGLPEDAPIVLWVGRIQPLKGLVTAVTAIAELHHSPKAGRAARAHLVVVGGPSGENGQAELGAAFEVVARRGLGDYVTFVPPQPHELLSSYYRAADVCCVPSRSESFGLVALEAAACGIPVVASAVGGLTRLVDHGRTGFLVRPGDPEGMAHFIGELLEDRALARFMGVAAQRRTAAYTWAEAAAKVARLARALRDQELVDCR